MIFFQKMKFRAKQEILFKSWNFVQNLKLCSKYENDFFFQKMKFRSKHKIVFKILNCLPKMEFRSKFFLNVLTSRSNYLSKFENLAKKIRQNHDFLLSLVEGHPLPARSTMGHLQCLMGTMRILWKYILLRLFPFGHNPIFYLTDNYNRNTR